MAIYSPGVTVGEIRGSIGGATFSRSAAGPTIRKKPYPSTKRLGQQQASRLRTMSTAPRFRTLTPAQAAAWTAYGSTITLYNSLGNPYTLTGSQAYNRNLVSYLGFVDNTQTAPVVPGRPATPTITLAYTGGALKITALSPTPANSDHFWGQLHFCAPATHSRPYYRILYSFSFYGNVTLPLTLYTGYFPALPTGRTWRAWVTFRLFDENKRLSDVWSQFLDYTT